MDELLTNYHIQNIKLNLEEFKCLLHIYFFHFPINLLTVPKIFLLGDFYVFNKSAWLYIVDWFRENHRSLLNIYYAQKKQTRNTTQTNEIKRFKEFL